MKLKLALFSELLGNSLSLVVLLTCCLQCLNCSDFTILNRWASQPLSGQELGKKIQKYRRAEVIGNINGRMLLSQTANQLQQKRMKWQLRSIACFRHCRYYSISVAPDVHVLCPSLNTDRKLTYFLNGTRLVLQIKYSVTCKEIPFFGGFTLKKTIFLCLKMACLLIQIF